MYFIRVYELEVYFTFPFSRKIENVGNLVDLFGINDKSKPFFESLRNSISNSIVVPRVKLYAKIHMHKINLVTLFYGKINCLKHTINCITSRSEKCSTFHGSKTWIDFIQDGMISFKVYEMGVDHQIF
jgi:hypothetical protein